MPRGKPLIIPWQEDAAELHQLYRAEEDHEISIRLHALWLLRSGQSMTQAATLVGVHYDSLQTWVTWYRQGGLGEVRRHKHGGRQGRTSFVSAQQIEQLQAAAAQGNLRTAADVRNWLAENCDVHYTPGGTYGLLARLRWKPKVTRPQNINTSATQQAEWQKGGSKQP